MKIEVQENKIKFAMHVITEYKQQLGKLMFSQLLVLTIILHVVRT